MECGTVYVRLARRKDREARAGLLRRSLRDDFANTCFYFFCQELTVEWCVLAAAVLFIFVGSTPTAACCLVLPAAVALVAGAVLYTNLSLADKQLQTVSGEMAGWVAECVPSPSPPQHCVVRHLRQHIDQETANSMQVIGTVSVTRHSEPSRSGWLTALCVRPEWRRRGVARALVGACTSEWATRGATDAMEACVTDLQSAGRACLHAAGWRLHGTYCRPVLWSALTLPVARLLLEPPHAHASP